MGGECLLIERENSGNSSSHKEQRETGTSAGYRVFRQRNQETRPSKEAPPRMLERGLQGRTQSLVPRRQIWSG